MHVHPVKNSTDKGGLASARLLYMYIYLAYIISTFRNGMVCSRLLYSKLRNTKKYEPHLNLPPYLRVPLARLRTSIHGLKIETGRYTIPNPTSVEERLCDLCGVTEDEVHFLINCSMTDNKERSNLFSHCTSFLPSFRYKSSRHKFLFIMPCKDTITLSYLPLSVSCAFLSRASRFHK